MMKKLGNITSIILSLGMAVTLALIIFKPTTTPSLQPQVLAKTKPFPSLSLDVAQVKLHLNAITLPPPPSPTPLIEKAPTPTPTPMVKPKIKKITIDPIKVSAPGTNNAPKMTPLKATEKKSDLTEKIKIKTIEVTPLSIQPDPLEMPEAELVVEKEAHEEIEVAAIDNQAPVVPEVTVTKSSQETKAGRALLKLLEHGNGPSIEIAWPDNNNQQIQLHNIFSKCFGMVTAIMDQQGNLYRAADNRGQTWNINTDRYSGFVRQASGKSTSTEHKSANSIRRHHNVSRSAQMVRVFPRQVDALLLGGLRRLVGPDYAKNQTIRARYQIQSGLVKIGNLIVDDASLNGTIALHVNPSCQGSYAL